MPSSEQKHVLHALEQAIPSADLLQDLLSSDSSPIERRENRQEESGATRAKQLLEIVTLLREEMSPLQICDWFHRPLMSLDSKRPIELIRAGEIRRVRACVGRYFDGNYG